MICFSLVYRELEGWSWWPLVNNNIPTWPRAEKVLVALCPPVRELWPDNQLPYESENIPFFANFPTSGAVITSPPGQQQHTMIAEGWKEFCLDLSIRSRSPTRKPLILHRNAQNDLFFLSLPKTRGLGPMAVRQQQHANMAEGWKGFGPIVSTRSGIVTRQPLAIWKWKHSFFR